MTAFIDIHSHSEKDIGVQYILVPKLDCPANRHYFVNGVHPWDFETKLQESLLFKHEKNPKYLGLGEVGLDKLKPNFELQIQRFEYQVNHASERGIRFIVLHNVKATQEILSVLKNSKFKGTILLHGFNGSFENFQQFKSKYNTYISCGEQLFKSKKLLNTLKSLPIDSLFFETDDSKLKIQDVYRIYAEHNDLQITDLQKQISNNFTKLMKDITMSY